MWVGGGDVFQEYRQHSRAVTGRPYGLMNGLGRFLYPTVLLTPFEIMGKEMMGSVCTCHLKTSPHSCHSGWVVISNVMNARE